jgi:hypothetical protein
VATPPEVKLGYSVVNHLSRVHHARIMPPLLFPNNLLGFCSRTGATRHYPSYCSKYNLIERRLFPHIGRDCTGMFDRLETVVELMRKATTSTGLKTTVNVIRRMYETGRNATDEIKHNLKIVFDGLLPKWNYRATPQHATVID